MALRDTMRPRSRRSTGRGRAWSSRDGWRQAIVSSRRRCTLLGLWGDPPNVHMALFDETSSEIAVISLRLRERDLSKRRRGPSAGASAWNARSAISTAGRRSGAPDNRPWLDHGSWDVRHPLGAQPAAAIPPPYASCRPKARPAPDRGRSGACRHHRAGPFPLHRQRRARGAAGAAARLRAQGHRGADGGRDARRAREARRAQLRRQHRGLCVCFRPGGGSRARTSTAPPRAD